MSDIGEYFKDYHELRHQQKDDRAARTLTWLKANNIPFVEGPNSSVLIGGGLDLWLTTHAWFDRKSHERGRGIGKLVPLMRDKYGYIITKQY